MIARGFGGAGDLKPKRVLQADGADLVDDDGCRVRIGFRWVGQIEDAERVRAVAHVLKPRVALHEDGTVGAATRPLRLAVGQHKFPPAGTTDMVGVWMSSKTAPLHGSGGLASLGLSAPVAADHQAIVGERDGHHAAIVDFCAPREECKA